MPRHARKVWQPYETSNVTEKGGIYAIRKAKGKIQYIGQSINLRKRLNTHKYASQQDISKFVKEEFAKNRGKNLRIKWIPTKHHKCLEGWARGQEDRVLATKEQETWQQMLAFETISAHLYRCYIRYKH